RDWTDPDRARRRGAHAGHRGRVPEEATSGEAGDRLPLPGDRHLRDLLPAVRQEARRRAEVRHQDAEEERDAQEARGEAADPGRGREVGWSTGVLACFATLLFWGWLRSEPYWRGALLAIALTCASVGAAVLLGFPLALGHASRFGAVRFVVFLYSWFFRATPTLLLLIIVWDVIPQQFSVFTHNWFSPFLAAFIALSLNEAAYMAQIIRAGLLAVDPGQELAGRALGMRRWQILRRVVVPQAVRIVIPPTGNEFISLLKLTA